VTKRPVKKPPAEFLALAESEPKLLTLLADIEIAREDSKRKSHACANALWFGTSINQYSFKDRLCELIGWERGEKTKLQKGKPRFRKVSTAWLMKEPKPLPPGPLYSTKSYDIAYDYLYSRLPDCRECLCHGVKS
jgi:hypothetical protein